MKSFTHTITFEEIVHISQQIGVSLTKSETEDVLNCLTHEADPSAGFGWDVICYWIHHVEDKRKGE